MKYKDLYSKACRMGDIRKDEYTKEDYIIDVNDLGRTLWTTIFQGVNGNKPDATRKETFTVTGNLSYIATRTIKKTPILKVVLDGSTYFPQITDKLENSIRGSVFSFEYNDGEIKFTNSVDGDYEVFYESATYSELDVADYDADAEPTWLKDDFHTIFWSYPAWMNANVPKVKADMRELYLSHKAEFEDYYSRTETVEEDILTANDKYDQL